MLEIRRDHDIHRADGGWFQARWHFSFDAYRDPRWNGVGPLRVFNHDRLAPGAVWPMTAGSQVTHRFGPGRGGYAYLIEGDATFHDEKMAGGDSARITDDDELRVTAIEPSEIILVDVQLRWQPVGVWASAR